MDYLRAYLRLWGREQEESVDRVFRNIRIVFILLPMGIIEAIISFVLLILMVPFIFSRGIDHFISSINVLYKTANYDEQVKGLVKNKWPWRMSRADKISRDFAIKEEKLVIGFIEKTTPFIIGILSTLITLFFADKL